MGRGTVTSGATAGVGREVGTSGSEPGMALGRLAAGMDSATAAGCGAAGAGGDFRMGSTGWISEEENEGKGPVVGPLARTLG